MRPFSRPKREYVVVSVGGSLVAPDDGPDTAFLTSFRDSILGHVRRGLSFYLVAGGGMTARRYQRAAERVRGAVASDDGDWLGIHATRLNAQLLRTIFAEDAQVKVVKNPARGIHGKHPIIVGGGWRPGWSTDYCAVMAAKRLSATRLVNLSDVDGVYAQDPDADPAAKKFDRLDWPAFRALIPDGWEPGLSTPFDPVAAKEAEAAGLEIAVMSGRTMADLDRYLAGDPFDGTLIR